MRKIYLLGLGLILSSSSAFSQYCTVGVGPTDDFDTNVEAVSLIGDATNITYVGCTGGGGGGILGLEDQTSQSADLTAGNGYTLDITWGSCGGFYANDGVAWIDFDGSQTFDVGEIVGSISWAGGTGNLQSYPFTVPALALNGTHRLRVMCTESQPLTDPCAGFFYGSAVDFSIVISGGVACGAPTALNATNITGTTADLNWTPDAGAVNHNVEWGAPGFTPGTGAELGSASAVVGGTTNATGLSPVTTYEFYVMTDCGGAGTSGWAGPFSFITPLGSLSCGSGNPFLIYGQDFEGGFPADWFTDALAASGPDWTYNTGQTISGSTGPSGAQSGTGYVYLETSSGTVGETDTLDSPPIDLSSVVAEARMTFYYHMFGATMGQLEVFTSTDGIFWTSQWAIAGQQQASLAAAWTPVEVDLTPYVGGLIYVKFVGSRGTSFTGDMAIDNFQVEGCVTCPGPSNLALVSSTTTSGNFSWTENGTATAWMIEYGPTGFTPGTGASVPAPTNPYNVTGLAMNSAYDFYVRSICGPGDSSSYVGPVGLSTYDLASFTFMETDVNCPTAGFIDIAPTGTGYDIADDGEQTINMTFPFIFQGNLMSDIRIGNNGGILLGVTTGDIATTGTVGAGTANGVYPWWDDLDSETGDVFYEEIGVAPNRIAVIQWDNICNFSGSIGAPTVTFQVQIHETSNEIYFVYDDVVFGAPNAADDFGGNASIGLAGPNQDFLISNDDMTFLMNNSCARFYYPTCPKPSNITSSYATTDSIEIAWTSNGSETSWIIEYGPTGFTPGTGTQYVAATNPDTVGVLIDNTVYDFYVYADCGAGDTSSYSGPGTFATDIVCPAPVGFAFTYTANDTAAYTWTPGGLEASWNIEYGPVGFIPGTGAGTSTTTAFIPDTTFGLNPGSVYDFYVQADCGMGLNNPWAGPLTYATPIVNDSTCDAVMVPVDGSTTTYTNFGATVQTGSTVPGFNTVWFTFIAPASGHVEIATCGNDFNNMMAVYDASDCSDFSTFNFVTGATGNPFVGCTGVGSAGANVCGLTPGNTYYLVVGSEVDGVTGLFPLTLTELPAIEAGTAVPQDVCEDNAAFDLFTSITGNASTTGTWYNPVAMAGNELPSMISIVGVPAGTYPMFYVQVEVCGSDTVESSITVIETPNVGMGSTIDAGCNYNSVSLADGLSGTIDFGGTWYAATGDTLTSSLVTYNMDPAGAYVYYYVVDNGVCAADTATVTVNVIDCASLDESALVLSVYPNPVRDILTVNLMNVDGQATVELFDVQGSLIIAPSAINNSTISVNMSNVADGVYILKITANGSTQDVRVVKQ